MRLPLPLLGLLMMLGTGHAAPLADGLLLDDFTRTDGLTGAGTRWRLATDQVMGGVSQGAMSRREIDGRPALCLSGDVSLANNGGFVQMNVDLASAGELNASGLAGVRLLVRGNGATYHLHLKTNATVLPWQSYRAGFPTSEDWQEVRLPFTEFAPYRLATPLDPGRLRRLGVVAIGEAMRADVCVAEIGFYGK